MTNKIKMLFYCKPFGDAVAIHDVLKESGDYEIVYDSNKIDEVDYVLTSHNDPPNLGSKKLLHCGHGWGIISKLPYNTYEELIEDHSRYYAYSVPSKLAGLIYCGLVKNIMVIGMPISIPLLSPVNEIHRNKFFESRGLDPKKKTIMYGPTWDHSWDHKKQHRGFFYLWWEDGKERERVDRFCKFITKDMNMNLIVRFHESFRYKRNWLSIYSDIFEEYGVYAHYIEQDMNSTPHMKYSNVAIGDLSNMNTVFYVMNKPVVHIGKDPYRERRNKGYGGMGINDRAGYIVDDFEDLLDCIVDSVNNPDRFEADRKKTTNKYIDYVGEDSKKAVLREFIRVCQK